MKRPSIDKTQISTGGVLAPFGHMATRRWFRWVVLAFLVLGMAYDMFAGR